jgi:hypothetical protein
MGIDVIESFTGIPTHPKINRHPEGESRSLVA